MIKLSKRLQAVADLVTHGNTICDVGTDHGYVPIYLLENGISTHALAMDVNPGPLQRAREHIRAQGLSEYIETRLSDGLAAMESGEADTVVMAGMGGGLMIRILQAGESVLAQTKELILQPQSDVRQVRIYLRTHGYRIDAEDMVREDGKYYVMFRCRRADMDDRQETLTPERQTAYDRYGELLIKADHPVLREYLQREERLVQEVCTALEQASDSVRTMERQRELKEKQAVLMLVRKEMEHGVQ